MSAPVSFLGEKIAVVIRIEDREKIEEELEDLEAIREFDEVKASRERRRLPSMRLLPVSGNRK